MEGGKATPYSMAIIYSGPHTSVHSDDSGDYHLYSLDEGHESLKCAVVVSSGCRILL